MAIIRPVSYSRMIGATVVKCNQSILLVATQPRPQGAFPSLWVPHLQSQGKRPGDEVGLNQPSCETMALTIEPKSYRDLL